MATYQQLMNITMLHS